MSLHSLLTQIKLIQSIDNLAAFKTCVKNSYSWLEAELGRVEIDTLVTGRASFVDALLRQAWRLLELEHDLTLIAVGGYGRGQLQPYSDVDLLILSKQALKPEQQENLSRFITFLWDVGLDIGQSVRTVKDTIKLAKEDITIATNLLESRLLIGDQSTFDSLHEKMQGRGFWKSKDFFSAKLDEQRRRHAKFHGTAYNLEPNVKENPGCLRDIQNIGWVAKMHFNAYSGTELVEHQYFTQQELDELLECRRQLWRIRFALHLEAGRSENRLLFDYQTSVAERLGYGGEGKASVERMMKAFFRQVRRISELNEMLLQRFQQEILGGKVRKRIRLDDNFCLADGLVEPTQPNVFDSPEAILQFLLMIADTSGVSGLSTDCIRQLRNARRDFSITYFVERADCRALFLQLMRHPNFFQLSWDIMHKHGILQSYLPEWDHIVGMMQFDLFHAYTVDEHTHRLVKNVQGYFNSEQQAFPRCHRIVKNLDKPELLFIAAIFHDIGKGRNGDHSKLGAQDVIKFARTHHLDEDDAELIRWLVDNHLLMSVIAQRRDIYDPDVVNEFASVVKSHNHLNHLYALTLADIRATNSNLWNDWKASLLRELYLLAQKALDNGLECRDTLQERANKHKQQALADICAKGYQQADIQALWERLDDSYFTRFTPKQLAWHADVILSQSNGFEVELVVDLSHKTNRAGTELLVYGKDKANLFAQVASVLDSRNCSIHDAQIMSTLDGYVFDSFILLEQDGTIMDSPSRLKSLKEAITAQLTKPGQEHQNNRKLSRQMRQLDVPTKVRFFDGREDTTLVELEALDTPGLLADLGQLLVENQLSLRMAKISTIGERAEDLLIVSNADGKSLSQDEQIHLKKHIIARLDQAST